MRRRCRCWSLCFVWLVARRVEHDNELIWLLHKRLHAVSCCGRTRACVVHAASSKPCHGSCQALTTFTRRPQSSASSVLRVLSSCIVCLAPPDAVDLLESCSSCGRCVCVRGGLAASVCICRTSAAFVELPPRGWRPVAFPRWFHVLRSKLLDVAHCSL